MSLTEKVAYIKGIIDGNGADEKVVDLLVELVDDLAHDVVALKEENETLRAYIEEIDDDLGYLEDVVFDDLDSDTSFDDFECNEDCECCDCDMDCDLCDKNEDYDFFKVVCPSCNEQVYLDNSIDPSNVICPSCHNTFSAALDN